jgi:regulator of protease activity HflC (stomatin/prohibitin superfamily)
VFIFAIILAVIGIIALPLGLSLRKKPAPTSSYDVNPQTVGSVFKWVGAGLLALGVILLGVSSTFTQSAGEADVLVSVTGTIDGSSTTPGFHTKAPWDEIVTFNIRNQQVVYVGNSQDAPDNTGGKANGPDVTVQDKDGVTDDIDIAMRYSIDAKSVISIYKSFKDEDTFKSTFIEQDVRSAVRTAPNGFTTLQLLTDRAEVEKAITEQIAKHWAGSGVSIDSVSMQEVRPPKNVVASYAAAQQAQIEVSVQQNKLNAAKVSAQQQIVQATAQAKANDILTQSLSPQVLQNKYLAALKAGTVYVVPAGSTPFIQTK